MLEIEDLAKKVYEAKIKKTNCNLNVQRYIEEFIEKEILDINEINDSINTLRNKLVDIQEELDGKLNKML